MKNAINWFEVTVNNLERAVAFYSKVLGKEISITDFNGSKMAMFPMEGQEGVGGHMEEARNGNAVSNTGTRVYLNCAGRLDEALSLVEEAGGKIHLPKTEVGNNSGYMAYIEDTEGNIVGLHSM